MNRRLAIASIVLLIAAVAMGVWKNRPVHAPRIPRSDVPSIQNTREARVESPPQFSEESPQGAPSPDAPGLTAARTTDKRAAISGIVVDGQKHPLDGVIVEARADGRVFGRVDTDASGHFAFLNLREGAYTLLSDTSRYTNASLEGVRTGASGVVLRLDATATIAGRIIHSESGAPIYNFDVVLLDEAPTQMMKLKAAKWRTFETTDGALEFTGVQARTEYLIAVRAQGFTPRIESVPPIFPGARSYPLTIALTRGASLEGTVTNQAGNPIEGATLYDRDWIGETFRLASSDAQGHFLAVGLEAGPLNLTIRHRDYAPAMTVIALRPASVERHDFTLKSGGRIEGTVLRGGKGIPNLVIHVFNQADPRQRFRAATDSRGNYAATALPAGDFIVILYTDENGNILTTDMKKFATVVEDRVTRIDFTFHETGASIEGNVLMFGEPPEQARVTVDVITDSNSAKFQTEVGPDGNYLLENLPAGDITITALARSGEDAYRHITVSFEIAPEEAIVQDFNFADAASVHGVLSGLRDTEQGHVAFLVGDERDAVPEPEELQRLSGLVAAQVQTGPDGAYRVMELESGTYTVVAAGVSGQPSTIAELLEGTRYTATLIEISEGEVLRLNFTL